MSNQKSAFDGLLAWKTLQLVGRKDIVVKAEQILSQPLVSSSIGHETNLETPHQDPHPTALFIIGEGGYGKTRLLEEVLLRAKELNHRAASQVIDFYDIANHRAEGLAHAIAKALSIKEFSKPEARSEVVGDEDSRIGYWDQVVLKLQEISANQKVVLAFDTAERLVYQSTKLHPWLESERIAESWRYLLKVLPTLPNVVVFFAGRPRATELSEQLKSSQGNLAETINVGIFSESESEEYFKAAAEAARNAGRQDVAGRIERYIEEKPEQLNQVYRRSRGRPILLALLITICTIDNPPPQILDSKAIETELDENIRELEEQLIQHVTNDLTSEGKVILALGRAPRGVDAALLHRLLETSSVEEAGKLLDAVRDLVIVKTPPPDVTGKTRFYLHDEMYDMLDRHVFSKGTPKEDERAYDAIQIYYRDELDCCQEALDHLYASIEAGSNSEIDLEELRPDHAWRRYLLTERVYYYLRHDPPKGFRHFYRYIREAILAHHGLLDEHVTVELMDFLARNDPQGDQATFPSADGSHALEKSEIMGVLALRPIARAWADGDFNKTLQKVQECRQQAADILASSPRTAAALNAWEAYARTFLSGEAHLSIAQELLDQVITSLASFEN